MAIRSFGTKIYVGGYLIGGLREVSPTSREASIIDVTCQDSSHNSRQFIGGMIDNGTLELQGLYDFDDDGQTFLRDNIETETNCSLRFSDGSGFTFSCFCKSFGEESPIDDAVGFSASIQIDGKVSPYPGTLNVTGELTDKFGVDVTFPALLYAGLHNDHASYSDDGEPVNPTTRLYGSICFFDGAHWNIEQRDDTTIAQAAWWTSMTDVEAPDLVPLNQWAPISGDLTTGTPEITRL